MRVVAAAPTTGRRRCEAQLGHFVVGLDPIPSLDKRDGPGNEGYAVFGKTVAGFPVVQAIDDQPTGSVSGFDDVPKNTIKMESTTRVACPPPEHEPQTAETH